MWVLRREPGCLFHKNAPHSITEKYLYFHTVRNLNFLSKNSTLRKIVELFWWLLVKMLRFWTFKLLTTLISREKWSKIWGEKLVKMLGIVDNFDWISRENCKVLSKLTFWTKKLTFRIVWPLITVAAGKNILVIILSLQSNNWTRLKIIFSSRVAIQIAVIQCHQFLEKLRKCAHSFKLKQSQQHFFRCWASIKIQVSAF